MRLARRGIRLREIARRFRLALSNVQHWIGRARGKRLSRTDFQDQPFRPLRPAHAVDAGWVTRILALRHRLREHDALGEYGPVAILRALRGESPPQALLPCRATIANILKRSGLVERPRRLRRPAPPPGWHLPDVAAGRGELDAFDGVEGWVIEAVGEVQALNAIALQGARCGSFLHPTITAQITRQSLQGHWQAHGLPTYAQFDNDLRFHGPHRHLNSLGSVALACLAMDVIPVFAPPREHGLQNQIESFNNLWQAKVWHRFHHRNCAQLRQRSDAFVHAHQLKTQERQESAPLRHPWPPERLSPHADPKVIFIRRTDDHGAASLLGDRFVVDALWRQRLVRCELFLRSQKILVFGLRRSQPSCQPLLATLKPVSTITHFARYLRTLTAANLSYVK